MKRFVWLNVLGGAAVLASYAWGLSALGDEADRAWGGVPEWLRPWYVRSMVLAAIGYFPMTAAILMRLRDGDVAVTRIATALYGGILVGSALWLPLTCRMFEQPSDVLWWTIRMDLAAVGLCSVAVLILLARRAEHTSSAVRIAAILGAAAFCLQTALLDAIVWPAYFFS